MTPGAAARMLRAIVAADRATARRAGRATCSMSPSAASTAAVSASGSAEWTRIQPAAGVT